MDRETELARLVRLNREEWSTLAEEFRDNSYRQAWDYGVLIAKKRRAVSEHVAIERDGETLGLADVRVKSAPVIGGGLAFISFGPLSERIGQSSVAHLEEILEALEQEYVRNRKFNLRIQPPLRIGGEGEEVNRLFESRGYSRPNSLRPYRTFLLDLEPPIESIRAELSRRWRRHLNQSERETMEVQIRNDAESLLSLVEFHRDFIVRKGFRTELDAGFYSQVQRELPEPKKFLVLLARVEDRVAAGAVMSLLGDTMVYLLGGRTDAGSRTRASYRLHWEAVQIAKERGIRWYDLGGTDPEANPGVHTFKEGMGGIDLTAPGPFELESGARRAGVLRTLEKIYRLNRKIGVL